MKKLLIAIAAVSLFSAQAHAEHDNGQGVGHQGQGQGQLQGQQQGQQQGQLQGQQQGQSLKNTNVNGNSNTNKNVNDLSNSNKNTNLNGQAQGQVNGNSDNTQAVTVNGDNVVYKAPEIPVSTAYAPNNFPTAPCMGSSSAGGSGMNIGLSFGTTWESKNCMYLETARSFEQAGYAMDALAIRCETEYAKKAPSCIALAKEKEVKAQAAANVAAQTRAADNTTTAVEAETSKKTSWKLPKQRAPQNVEPVVSPNGYYSVVTNPLAM